MYKCSECGTEYEIQPKYCECGNDIFINVEDDFVPEEIEDFEEETEPKRASKYHGGRNFRKKNFSPLSIGVFAFCIILSILVLFVIANPKKDLTKTEIKTETTEKTEIPSVESYWDNTPAKIVKKEEPKEPKQENIIEKIVQQIVPQEQIQKQAKPVTNAVKTPIAPQKTTMAQPKAQTKIAQKQTTTKTASKSSSKPAQSSSGMTFGDLTNKIKNQYPAQSTQTQTQTAKQTSQTATTKQSAPIPQTTNTTTQTSATQTQIQTQTTPKTTPPNAPKPQTQAVTQTQTQTATATVPQKSQAQLRQELSSYKTGLRNAIGRKIDFTKVIGDGDCTLSFKINSNGRLTSKAFTKQSSNLTLNDAAFNALNTMTSFNPPPEGYNGETLHLYIKFYNGNFEISLN